jgi:GxxExxY protein
MILDDCFTAEAQRTAEERGGLSDFRINRITQAVIGAAIEVHRQLGPGLLESAYVECLSRELTLRGINFERERALPLEYKGVRLECGYRVDLLIERSVVVEVKSI